MYLGWEIEEEEEVRTNHEFKSPKEAANKGDIAIPENIIAGTSSALFVYSWLSDTASRRELPVVLTGSLVSLAGAASLRGRRSIYRGRKQ